MEINVEKKEIEQLINYHQAGLDQYRQHMSPSSGYLEEQTIKALKELEQHLVRITDSKIKDAKALIEKHQRRLYE